jgi:hypothetical protein
MEHSSNSNRFNDDSKANELELRMELQEREIIQREKEKSQEKYDSILALQFHEEDPKETGKILRSLCTYISEMYKVYMAKFNEGLTLLKMTEPNSPMTTFIDSKKVGRCSSESAEQWETDRLYTYMKNHNGYLPKYNQTTTGK